jgi:hypothetical protein
VVADSYFGGFSFFHFISRIFYHQSFAPIGLQKTNVASGWLVKYLSVNYCDFFNANRRCNTKIFGR